MKEHADEVKMLNQEKEVQAIRAMQQEQRSLTIDTTYYEQT